MSSSDSQVLNHRPRFRWWNEQILQVARRSLMGRREKEWKVEKGLMASKPVDWVAGDSGRSMIGG